MEKNQHAGRRSKKRQKYTRNACHQCKRRKLKCSGGPHCRRCTDRRVRCTYEGETSPARALAVASRYQGLEAGLQQWQSSLDLALKRVEELNHGADTDVDIEAYDEELDALLTQTAREINAWLSESGNNIRPLKVGSEHSPGADSFIPSSCFLADDFSSPIQVTPEPASLPFSKTEAIQLIEYFRFEGERFYPFIQFNSLLVFVDMVFDPSLSILNPSTGSETLDWDDGFDARNLDLLRLLLACALASKVNRETETSRHLASMAFAKLATKVIGPMIDAKDIAIATLLSIYHLQCDETVHAWRKISTAAKMSQELGLHKSLNSQLDWVSKMFWSIYVLDRRFSFMINCPFTLHDEDIGHNIPEYDRSLYHLSSLIEYVRLAARFVLRMPKLGSSYILMEPSTCISLDIETDKWALSTSMNRPLSYNLDHLDFNNNAPGDQFNEAWIVVCKNQLKIGLYKHYLFSSDNVCQNPHLSHKAVSSASDTIRSCSELRKATPMYEHQAVNFNFFVLSAVAALYLAVRHAPLQFCNAPRDIFTGLEILKACCTSGMGSERLCEKVSTLEIAMKKLGYDPLGIGPQLTLREISSNMETPQSMERCWNHKTEVQTELTPRSESFSSFLSQMIATECIGLTADHPFLESHSINTWETQEWTV